MLSLVLCQSVTSGPLETTEQEFDLSPFVWTSLESLLGFHFVSVAAMGGGRPSENTTRTFTFNKYKGANVVCTSEAGATFSTSSGRFSVSFPAGSLDFPPVDVDVEGSRATVTFPNPLHYYEPLKKVTRGNGATVAFTVSFEAMIFFVALLASFVVVVTVLVFTVVKVKAWTMEVPALPKPLMPADDYQVFIRSLKIKPKNP
ncbi:unnamed protein product [Lampetra planeri]